MSTHILLNSPMRKVGIGYFRDTKRYFCLEDNKIFPDNETLTQFLVFDELVQYIKDNYGRRASFDSALKCLKDESKMRKSKERDALDKQCIDWTTGIPVKEIV